MGWKGIAGQWIGCCHFFSGLGLCVSLVSCFVFVQPLTVEVKAAAGYPEDGNFGIQYYRSNLEICEVYPGKWADQNTNLQDYVGYCITKINGTDMSDGEQFNAFKRKCEPGEPLVFTLAQVSQQNKELSSFWYLRIS